MAHAHEWDAATYHVVAGPQTAWGVDVLNRVALVGTETALDLGCGSGRLTEVLAARLPMGRVIAADDPPFTLDYQRLSIDARKP